MLGYLIQDIRPQNSLIMPSHLIGLWHYLEFLADVYPVTNALILSIYSYNECLTALCLQNREISFGGSSPGQGDT